MGILAACFAERSGLKYCIVQLYETLDPFGTQVLNCPLYSLTSTFWCVPSSSILSSVSLFHECFSYCTFSHTNSVSQIERETVTTFILSVFTECILYASMNSTLESPVQVSQDSLVSDEDACFQVTVHKLVYRLWILHPILCHHSHMTESVSAVKGAILAH